MKIKIRKYSTSFSCLSAFVISWQIQKLYMLGNLRARGTFWE